VTHYPCRIACMVTHYPCRIACRVAQPVRD
jgi:hypothetical protein